MVQAVYLNAVTINFLIPLSGLVGFLLLLRRMRKEQIPDVPALEIFLLFATYGLLLVVLLTNFFSTWSAIASLDTFYLVLGAPIAMAIIAFRTKKKQEVSRYHRGVFLAAVAYFIIAPLSLMLFGKIS